MLSVMDRRLLFTLHSSVRSRNCTLKNHGCILGKGRKNALADLEIGARLGRGMVGMTKDSGTEWFMNILW
jgi:hypothetical protein